MLNAGQPLLTCNAESVEEATQALVLPDADRAQYTELQVLEVTDGAAIASLVSSLPAVTKVQWCHGDPKEQRRNAINVSGVKSVLQALPRVTALRLLHGTRGACETCHPLSTGHSPRHIAASQRHLTVAEA